MATPEPYFALTVAEAWELSSFLQRRMTDEEAVGYIGEFAHRLCHWCRENPDL